MSRRTRTTKVSDLPTIQYRVDDNARKVLDTLLKHLGTGSYQNTIAYCINRIARMEGIEVPQKGD